MTDYLRPVSNSWRILSIAGCLLAFLACAFLEGVLGWVVFRRRSPPPIEDLLLLTLAATFIALLAAAAVFSAWRIFLGKPSANGLTLLPGWFIQTFGVCMLLAHLYTSYLYGSALLLIEGTLAFLGMVFLGRHIERRRREVHDRQEWDGDGGPSR